MMEEKLATIETFIDISDDIFYATRHTCEQVIKNSSSFAPMLTFFASSDKVSTTVVVNSYPSFEETLLRISEALYLYSPLNAHAVMVSINSDIHDDDGNYISSSLNTFTLSDAYAFITTMPYSVDDKLNVSWYTEKFETSNVLDKNFEGISKEMVNLFYMFTHVENSPYTVQEVLSYLTFVGATISIHENTPISFYDMTPQ